MKTFLLVTICIFRGFYIVAQNAEVIHPGDNLSDHFTYRFPSFADARILFKNGTVSVATMNFNTFLCKIQFIDAKGDTLVLSKPEEIDSISLNSHTFYYDKGYYEIIARSDSVMLVVLSKVHVDVIVVGALGVRTRTASIASFDSYITPSGWTKFEGKDDLSVEKETTYFLIGKNGINVAASKAGFLKVFATDKKNVDGFLKANKINFNNRDDLEKLLVFCTRPKTNF